MQDLKNTVPGRRSFRLAINRTRWWLSRMRGTASCRTATATMSSTRTVAATLTSLTTWQVRVQVGARVHWSSTGWQRPTVNQTRSSPWTPRIRASKVWTRFAYVTAVKPWHILLWIVITDKIELNWLLSLTLRQCKVYLQQSLIICTVSRRIRAVSVYYTFYVLCNIQLTASL